MSGADGSGNKVGFFIGRFFLLSLVLQLGFGCATLNEISLDETRTEKKRSLIWPPPPHQPRITYVRDVVFPGDILRSAGWWSRVKEIITGKIPIEMVRPYGLSLDQDQNLLIADPGSHVVHIYNLENSRYRRIPHAEDSLLLLSPIDVDVESNGRVYVSDSAAGEVYVFNPHGRYEKTIGEFSRPTGLAVNNNLSRLYVVDTSEHRIRVYSSGGEHLFDFGKRGTGQGEFNFPTNICLDRGGNVYVTDSMNFRIQVFDEEGRSLRSVGQIGSGPGSFSKPRGVAVDSQRHVYVTDATFDNVQIFDPLGHMLLYFGSPGGRAGEFYLPAGIEIDDRDRIFVSDSFNRRIQVFQYLEMEEELYSENEEKGPESILMVGREGDSVFLVEKSTGTLFHYKKGKSDLRLLRSYSFKAKNLDRLDEGVLFVTRQAAVDSSARHEILLQDEFTDSPLSRTSQQVIVRWGGDAAKQGVSEGKVLLLMEEDLSSIVDDLRISVTPFIVQERVDMLPKERVEQELPGIRKVLYGWEGSMEALDIRSYIQFYSREFKNGEMDLKGWRAFKASIFANRQRVELAITPIHILKAGPFVMLTYLQSYQSDVWQDFGVKKMLMHRQGKDWRIIREAWKSYEDR